MANVSWRRVQKGIAGLPGRVLHGYPIAFNRDKQRLIDHAFGTLPIEPRSCADLGGVWGIDAAYTFYLLRRHRVDRAVLVDTHFTEAVRRRGAEYPQLELLRRTSARMVCRPASAPSVWCCSSTCSCTR